MRIRSAVAVLLVASGILAAPPAMRGALAVAPAASDLTDFITRLGGYLQPSGPAAGNPAMLLWSQVSYKASTATTGNITTIVMTKYPNAAIYAGTGNGILPSGSGGPSLSSGTPSNATALPPAQFYSCSQSQYIVETVTLDLRDLNPVAPVTTGTDGPGGPTVWYVALQTADGVKPYVTRNLIRVNKQTLPATCAATYSTTTTAISQQDTNRYQIIFDDPGQAYYFQMLLRNVIPLLSPPNVVPVPASP